MFDLVMYMNTGGFDRYICGKLPMETIIFAGEIQAITKAVTIIEESVHLNWTIITDSP